ncbi:MAG: IPT/TIG domain-containing protein [Myxococcota bacterium]
MRRAFFLFPLLALGCGSGTRSGSSSETTDTAGEPQADTRTEMPQGLSSLAPVSGPSGTPVTFSGEGFIDGIFATFAGLNCNGIAVMSPTQATCFAPALATTGAVDVQVVWPNGGTATLSGAFTYVAGSGGDGGGNDGGGE